jgi:hypothetical protein
MSLDPRRELDGKPFFLIGIVWLVSRALVLLVIQSRIPFYWEVYEIKKLLDYGFLSRAGALVNIQYLPGHLSNPEVFNYVNHPYPIMWVFALAYRILGPPGMVIIVLVTGLAGCLAVLAVLRTSFTPVSAFVGTLLYVVAPTSILFDTNTNVVALGAIIWPAAAFIYSVVAAGRDQSRFAVYVGLIVFLCGQISWFTLSIVPALMVMTAKADTHLQQQALRFWKNRFWLAIIIGAALTALLFCLQIWFYSTNLTASFSYALAHAGSEGGFLFSRLKMCAFITAKGFLLVGPALVIGAVFGLICFRKAATTPGLIRGAVAGFACALFAALILIRFYYRERTPYAYLLFPATVLTAYALDRVRSWLRPFLGGLAAVGLVYVALQISSPVTSNAAKTLSDFLRQRTQPEDVVLSDLREQQPPFPSWDTGSREVTMLAADRLLYYGIESNSQLNEQIDAFSSQQHRSRFLFLHDSTRATSPDLRRAIEQNGQLLSRISLPLPVELKSPVLRLRSYYWRITGSPFAQQTETSTHPNMEFELYEMKTR